MMIIIYDCECVQYYSIRLKIMKEIFSCMAAGTDSNRVEVIYTF